MEKAKIKTMVDRLAEIRNEEKKLKNESEQIKTDLASLGEKFIEGNNYVLIIKDGQRTSLDLDRIKDEMGAFWYEQHLVTTYFQKFDVESKNSQT